MGDWNSAGWPGGTLEYSRINSQAEGYLVIYSNRVGSSLPRPKCLTLPKPIIGAPITANGTQLFVEDCWDFRKITSDGSSSGTGRSGPPRSTRSSASMRQPPGPVADLLWDCNGSGSQRWELRSNGQLVAEPGTAETAVLMSNGRADRMALWCKS